MVITLIKFLALLCVSLTVHAGRILVVVPTPSISHQVVFRPLTQELARRGHEVVIITTDPAFSKGKTPENITEIDLHDMSYKRFREIMISVATSVSNNDIFKQMELMMPQMTDLFVQQMLTDEVQSVIGNATNHFDLIMTEAYVRPAISMVHLFKAPLILISSFGAIGNQNDLFGAPSRPALLYPTIFRQRLTNLSLWEKIQELYSHYYFESIFQSQYQNHDLAIKKLFGPDTPSLTELENKVDMLFLNVHPIWEFNRPVPPGIIYMGGIHQKPSKELPKDLKTYLDSSKNGVIYISYGTNVDPTLLPPERIQILVKTFSQLPYNVLWKWNNDELPGRSNNIRISKWLPQSDLLKHPKIKLFITQGGLQSTDEAITAGVPLIGMPMFTDQWYNVEQYVYHKIGLRVDMETLTEEKFRTAIETVINDKSYRANIVKLRGIMRDQPQSPLDRAVWWAEHVMRHGGAPHLRARVANMTWSEYLDVELLAVLATGALISLVVLGYVATLLYKVCSRSITISSQKMKSS